MGKPSFAENHPELAKEWHPTKNGNLKPEDITSGSHKKVWWILPYDDPKTGKHFDFEWRTSVKNRALRGLGCPYLSGNAVWKGFNDLATTHPELTKEWHPEKNGNLRPEDVTAGSGKKVWWLLPYDDPKTGKHFDFEWRTPVKNRALHGLGCPYLSGNAVWKGFNDLATTHPELAKEWHPKKNGNLRSEDVTAGSGKKVWWLLPYDDPNTGKHFDFEWETSVYNRTLHGLGCPYLSGKAVCVGFNDLTTTNPELAKEWHPTKNGNLKPEDITAGSEKKVWWLLPYDDPDTGKHFDFEWETVVYNRALQGLGCPYLSGNAVWKGFNDLATTHPGLAKEWHPEKNENLRPEDVTDGSNKKIWWLLPHDDPDTGKHFDFEWEATLSSRTKGSGCPYLSGKAVLIGFNDLTTTHPELAKEWHPTKNGNLKPEDVTFGSFKKVWWLKSYKTETGENLLVEWVSAINCRVRGSGCWMDYGSSQEIFVCKYLLQKGIDFSFDEPLKGFKSRRLDIFIENENLAIEIDGEQHFSKINFFHEEKEKNIRSFTKQIERDNFKNEYCHNNGIKLLRIPYTFSEEKIVEDLECFLKDGTISQDVIDWYSRFEFSNYVQFL